MTSRTIISTAMLLMMTMTILHVVSAQEAPAPAPASTDCQTVLFGLSDCLTYVEEGSNLTKPDKPCCPELAGLVKNNPICLCYLLANSNSSSSIGIQIDVNRALKLPTVCKVDTPPASTCAILGIPVSSPTASEAPASSPGPGSALETQGPAAATSPATNKKNGASKTAHSAMAFLGGLVIAFLPTLF